LTGKYRRGEPVPEGTRLSDRADQITPQRLDTIERLIALAESRGHTLLELAFSWLLARPRVASVIAGATRPEQVRANAAAADWQLDEEDLAEVDAIVPAPG
ncbi:MAG TPA: aldo/keto reductase, partial [Phycisphaeraceae bacterium]